jgi:hypothetical protein
MTESLQMVQRMVKQLVLQLSVMEVNGLYVFQIIRPFSLPKLTPSYWP